MKTIELHSTTKKSVQLFPSAADMPPNVKFIRSQGLLFTKTADQNPDSDKPEVWSEYTGPVNADDLCVESSALVAQISPEEQKTHN